MIVPSVTSSFRTVAAEISISEFTLVKDPTNVNIVRNDSAFPRIYVITLERIQVSVSTQKDSRENGQSLVKQF